MGLEFSHGGASWSYKGYLEFRKLLAKEIGIKDLTQMEGLNRYYDKDLLKLSYTTENPKSWTEYEDDPITILIRHSDCDGSLVPSECKKIAPRLRELVSGWDDENFHKENALALAEGMEMAAESFERLKFL